MTHLHVLIVALIILTSCKDNKTPNEPVVISDGIEALKNDLSIPVSNAVATSYQNGENIEKATDGNFSTIYHSSWSNTQMPVTITFNFSGNTGVIDYMVYNPRTDGGTNGNFMQFDVFVATSGTPELKFYNSFDLYGSSSPAIITFDPALENPTQIQIKVNSGVGGFASCAEMQFFGNNPDNFDWTTLFTDITCSELKSGITQTDIDHTSHVFYKNLATELLGGNYRSDFRIQHYRAWQHPDVMATANKTGTYSLRDNPTGIFIRRGEPIIVFADGLHQQQVSIFVQDPNKMIGGSAHILKRGMNKFMAANDGLIYVMYHTRDGKSEDIKLHFATGTVNGYFDTEKHRQEEWKTLLAQAKFEHFDLVGKYAHLTFETEMFRKHTPDGKLLIETYDDMVKKQQDFMGLTKYGKSFGNRMYFVVMSGSSYMHAASYYTGYDKSTQDIMLNRAMLQSNCWGPAHEVGHIHQTRPALRWRGMTEVTNNIHSLYIQTQWGMRSRLAAEERYDKAFAEIIRAKIPHNTHDDVFCKLVPFWQLKLYMHDVLGQHEFYADVYERARTNPDPPTDGACQLAFVETACDVAQLDLTDFFEAWGFLTPVSVEIDDYGKDLFTITQAMIDKCKAAVAEKNYAKPRHRIQDITDDNLKNFVD